MTTPRFHDPSPEIVERITQTASTSPMAQWLHVSVSLEDNKLRYRLNFNKQHVGNPLTASLHGGVISSFFEYCAVSEFIGRSTATLSAHAISTHCNYLRPTGALDMIAEAEITKLGRRVAFVDVTGWQTSPDRPIARAAIALRTTGT